jgi:antitoxin PrlF
MREPLKRRRRGITIDGLLAFFSKPMTTSINGKGQVTIPKQIRDALDLRPGTAVNFAVNAEGDVVIHKVGARGNPKPDRFERAKGKADIKWRTDNLMALLRAGR